MNKHWAVVINLENEADIVYHHQSSEDNFIKFSDAKKAAIYFLRQQMRKQSENIKKLQSLKRYDCQNKLEE